MRILGICLILTAGWVCSAQAAVYGRMDTFQNGAVQGWGGGSAPTNISTGGPDGAGDRFLRISAANSKLATFNNSAAWNGNYLASGITRIEMDLNNFSAAQLEIRLMFVDAGGQGGNFTSLDAFILPAISGWVRAVFDVSPSALVYVGAGVGSGVYNDTMDNVDRLLIRNDPGAPSPASDAPNVTAQLGIDNIRAIPEPASAALLLLGFLPLFRRRRSPATPAI